MAKDKRKLSHEELQRDEVAEGVHHSLVWVIDHRNLVIVVVLMVLAAVLVLTAYASHKAKVRGESSAMLVQGVNYLSRLESEETPEQRKEAFEGAITRADTVLDAFAGSSLAPEALFLKGRSDYAMDDFEQAQAAYEQYIDEAGSKTEQARGEIALGYAYENDAFFKEDPAIRRARVESAQARYDRAMALVPDNSYLYTYAMLGKARTYELLGDNELAIELYETVIKDRPAALADETDAETEDAEDDGPEQFLRKTIEEYEAQLSFEATAKLRLERLQSQAGKDVAAPVTITTRPAAETGATTDTETE